MITSISSFVTWTVWTPPKDADLSEAPVGESVDPCCASQAIPPPSDHKGEMTYEPMIPDNPPSNITPLLSQNNQRYLLLSPQSTQSDQILWVFTPNLHFFLLHSLLCFHHIFLHKILTLALVWFMASWNHLRLWASSFCTSMYIESNWVECYIHHLVHDPDSGPDHDPDYDHDHDQDPPRPKQSLTQTQLPPKQGDSGGQQWQHRPPQRAPQRPPQRALQGPASTPRKQGSPALTVRRRKLPLLR